MGGDAVVSYLPDIANPENLQRIVGKTIAAVTEPDDSMDSIIRLTFTDGSQLDVRYDWIYEFIYKEKV